MNFKAGIAATAAAVMLSGCATVINGPNLDYMIMSEPDGAIVSFNDGTVCETPCERSLSRSNHLRVDFEKEGYEPTFVLVQSKTGAATAGNILAGGIIGAVVDGSNGSNRFLSPRPLYVQLVPLGSGEEPLLLEKDGEVISTVAEHNNEVRDKVVVQLGPDLVAGE